MRLVVCAVVGCLAVVAAARAPEPQVSWYSPVRASFLDLRWPWKGQYDAHADDADNPGVIGLGVNFLLGECGETNGLLLNLGLLGLAGDLGKVSSCSGTIRGVTLGTLANANGRTEGVMIAPFNFSMDINGCMIGLVNVSRLESGFVLQAGLANRCENYGDGFAVQVGLYNSAEQHVLQIGALNKISESLVFPLVNLSW